MRPTVTAYFLSVERPIYKTDLNVQVIRVRSFQLNTQDMLFSLKQQYICVDVGDDDSVTMIGESPGQGPL